MKGRSQTVTYSEVLFLRRMVEDDYYIKVKVDGDVVPNENHCNYWRHPNCRLSVSWARRGLVPIKQLFISPIFCIWDSFIICMCQSYGVLHLPDSPACTQHRSLACDAITVPSLHSCTNNLHCWTLSTFSAVLRFRQKTLKKILDNACNVIFYTQNLQKSSAYGIV